MRGKGSLETFKRAYQALNAEDTKIGIHTVVDEQNVKQLETIYNYLKTRNFDSWKIYEINRRIGKNTKEFTPQSVEEETQGLFAQFLLAEEKMHKHKDKRIKFIAAEDKKPYVFLRSNGQISYGAWFSSERKIFGNMFNEPIKRITERITRYIEEAKDSEQFFEGKAELPLFARIYEGNVWTEELEAADQLPKKTVNKILKLEKLYIEHQEARE